MTKKIIFQIICIILLLVSHFHFSYDFNGAWWHSALGFCLICFFGYLIWGKQFITVTGLKITPGIFLKIIIATFIFTGISVIIMLFIADKNAVSIHLSSIKNYIHNAFYILSEEMIMGSVMLYFLINRFKIKPLAASLGLAAVLAIVHFVLYKLYFRDKDFLTLSTLIALLLTVFVKNNLIIRYKHIGYAWALHFGWMAVMYGSEHVHLYSNIPLTDLEKFNLYLGSFEMVLISIILTGVNLFFYFRLQQQNAKQDL